MIIIAMNNSLQISKHTSISLLQGYFNGCFPYLKLEFFKKRHNAFPGTARIEYLSPNFQFGDLNNFNEETLNFDPEMTVAELEKFFRQKFNLGILVFRKSGNTWIETTLTWSWTLGRQNDEGLELANFSV